MITLGLVMLHSPLEHAPLNLLNSTENVDRGNVSLYVTSNQLLEFSAKIHLGSGAAASSLVAWWAAESRVERSILLWGNVSSQLHLISPGCPRPNSALIVQKSGLKPVHPSIHLGSETGCTSLVPYSLAIAPTWWTLVSIYRTCTSLINPYSASHDNWCTVGGDGGCRVGEVRAGTTSSMPDHKGFKLQ